RGAGPVDVRELDDEIVYPILRHGTSASVLWSAAYGMTTLDFCMSHAPVGQRSAHSPQCTQRFSSFTITRPVCFSGAETNSGCSGFRRGAFSDRSSSGASAFRA